MMQVFKKPFQIRILSLNQQVQSKFVGFKTN